MGVKALNPEVVVCSLKDLIDNLKDKTPDWYEAKILESLAEMKGNLEYYNVSLFLETVNLGTIEVVETPYLYNREKVRLDFLKFFQKNLAQTLTHNNPEVRKLSTELGRFLDDRFPNLNSVGEKLENLISDQAILVGELKTKFTNEINRIVKEDENASCMEKVDLVKFKIKKGTKFLLDGETIVFDNDEVVKLKRPKKGTNYLVYVTKNSAIEVHSDFQNEEGRILVGGFHFAPGSNATDERRGGDNIPQINEHSIWDLSWRPMARDPRGMTLVQGEFWVDIYPMTTDGGSTYGEEVRTNINWWETNQILSDQGKMCPTEEEFQKLAFGTTENQSSGERIEKASLAEKFTSKWGVMMSTGCYYVWGAPFRVNSDEYKEQR